MLADLYWASSPHADRRGQGRPRLQELRACRQRRRTACVKDHADALRSRRRLFSPLQQEVPLVHVYGTATAAAMDPAPLPDLSRVADGRQPQAPFAKRTLDLPRSQARNVAAVVAL